MKFKNIILLTLTLALSALSAGLAEAQGVIKGANLTMAMYVDPDTGKDVQINMDPKNKKTWYEHSQNGPFTFSEVGRDEWTVFLRDATREMVMQINLHKKKITYGAGGADGRITEKFGEYAIKHSQ